MKKQITEIEREIIEKSNRSTSFPTAGSSSVAAAASVAAVSASSGSQTNYTQQQSTSNVPSSSLSASTAAHMTTVEKVVAESSRNADIDLDSLDPLGKWYDTLKGAFARGWICVNTTFFFFYVSKGGSSPPPPAPAPHRDNRNFPQSSANQTAGVEATIKDIRMTLQRTKTLPLRPSCVTNGDNDDRESCNSNKSETPIWVPR